MYYTFYQYVYDPNPPQEMLTEDLEPIRNMCGETFHSFLKLCFKYASHFSFSRAPWAMCTDTMLERELARFEEAHITTSRWFGYNFPDDTMEVLVYHACPEAESVLKEHCLNLFMDYCQNHRPRGAPTLENLCFFGQDTMFIGTISHEFICAVYPPNGEFERCLLHIDRWQQETNDEGFERVILSQYYSH